MRWTSRRQSTDYSFPDILVSFQLSKAASLKVAKSKSCSVNSLLRILIDRSGIPTYEPCGIGHIVSGTSCHSLRAMPVFESAREISEQIPSFGKMTGWLMDVRIVSVSSVKVF